MRYKIAIPTYKREQTIKQKTLTTLKQCNISPEYIDIFVADKTEYNNYKKNLDPDTYNKIIIGTPTLHKQRNFIRKYYPENQLILNMDDDIEGIYIKKGNNLIPFQNLNKLSILVNKLLHKYNSKLCGVYPVHNAFYMQENISKGLYFIVGAFYYTINSKNPWLDVNIPIKHDYEFSIKNYLLNQNNLRLNNITVKTNYYKNKGGLNEYRNNDNIYKSAMYLLNKYPDLVSINNNKKESTEIKFKRQKNNYKIDLRGNIK